MKDELKKELEYTLELLKQKKAVLEKKKLESTGDRVIDEYIETELINNQYKLLGAMKAFLCKEELEYKVDAQQFVDITEFRKWRDDNPDAEVRQITPLTGVTKGVDAPDGSEITGYVPVGIFVAYRIKVEEK